LPAEPNKKKSIWFDSHAPYSCWLGLCHHSVWSPSAGGPNWSQIYLHTVPACTRGWSLQFPTSLRLNQERFFAAIIWICIFSFVLFSFSVFSNHQRISHGSHGLILYCIDVWSYTIICIGLHERARVANKRPAVLNVECLDEAHAHAVRTLHEWP
jgi:hypothetical protein